MASKQVCLVSPTLVYPQSLHPHSCPPTPPVRRPACLPLLPLCGGLHACADEAGCRVAVCHHARVNQHRTCEALRALPCTPCTATAKHTPQERTTVPRTYASSADTSCTATFPRTKLRSERAGIRKSGTMSDAAPALGPRCVGVAEPLTSSSSPSSAFSITMVPRPGTVCSLRHSAASASSLGSGRGGVRAAQHTRDRRANARPHLRMK